MTPRKAFEVLAFFLGDSHGIVDKKEAVEMAWEILDEPKKDAAWEDHKKPRKLTDRQTAALSVASKAFGVHVSDGIGYASAVVLIEELRSSLPGYSTAVDAELDRLSEIKGTIGNQWNNVDDWREFQGCKKVPAKAYEETIWHIGPRGHGEGLDVFMDRFFARLRETHPQLFSSGSGSNPAQRNQPPTASHPRP